jgi:hypothetical protein
MVYSVFGTLYNTPKGSGRSGGFRLAPLHLFGS